MVTGPQRLPAPAAYVTAHVAPVERALLERARVLEDESTRRGPTALLTLRTIAAEFRALAAELHHWQ